MSQHRPNMDCPHCGKPIPEGSELCPECGKKIKPRLGTLTDEQIRRIKRPLTIVAWIAVAVVIYLKFLR